MQICVIIHTLIFTAPRGGEYTLPNRSVSGDSCLCQLS
jgi:hypothetical protein